MNNIERELLKEAIIEAINKVGLAAFKRTSLFLSNEVRR